MSGSLDMWRLLSRIGTAGAPGLLTCAVVAVVLVGVAVVVRRRLWVPFLLATMVVAPVGGGIGYTAGHVGAGRERPVVPALGPPALSAPSPSPSPSPEPSPDRPATTPSIQPSLSVSVTCTAPASGRRGTDIAVDYVVTTTRQIRIAVGAGLYPDSGEDDQSDGAYDQDSVVFSPGTTARSRQVHLPDQLAPGRFEVTVELWPANRIGQGETIADSSCGYLTVS